MDILKEICEELNRVLVFDVEIVYACGEPYLCIFHNGLVNEMDIKTMGDVINCGHMTNFFVNKYYSDKVVLEDMNSYFDKSDKLYSCVFKVTKPNLSKSDLKLDYGIDCGWENDYDCPKQESCIEFGECVFMQEWEDRCL